MQLLLLSWRMDDNDRMMIQDFVKSVIIAFSIIIREEVDLVQHLLFVLEGRHKTRVEYEFDHSFHLQMEAFTTWALDILDFASDQHGETW